MELLDVYNDRNEPLNIKIPRNLVHENGLWHRKFVCIIVDEKEKSVLFQRQYKKESNEFSRPQFLNLSIGGHLVSGEKIEDGIRELHEESGLNYVEFKDLKFLGIRQSSFSLEKNSKKFINNEFQYIFIYKGIFNENSFNINNKEESKGFVSIKINDGIKLLTNKINFIEAIEYINNKKEIIKITKNDFIPDYLKNDTFILRNFVVSKRYLKNPDDELLFW